MRVGKLTRINEDGGWLEIHQADQGEVEENGSQDNAFRAWSRRRGQ